MNLGGDEAGGGETAIRLPSAENATSLPDWGALRGLPVERSHRTASFSELVASVRWSGLNTIDEGSGTTSAAPT